MESEGKTVSDNARLKQAAARKNRRSKNFNPDLIRTRALEMDVRHGYQAQRVVAEARERLPLRLSQREIEKRAQEAVTFARDKVMEKTAVADMVEAERVNEMVTGMAEHQQRSLNAKQQSAIEQILSSKDQIIGLQGGAGTGKTTALSVLREAAEKEGYAIVTSLMFTERQKMICALMDRVQGSHYNGGQGSSFRST